MQYTHIHYFLPPSRSDTTYRISAFLIPNIVEINHGPAYDNNHLSDINLQTNEEGRKITVGIRLEKGELELGGGKVG